MARAFLRRPESVRLLGRIPPPSPAWIRRPISAATAIRAYRPEAPAWIALLLLFVPVPLFLTQSFMAMGDLTPASGALAAVTLLLPVGMALTILCVAKQSDRSRTALLHGLAAALVLQSCAVLASAGLLPLRLWS